MTTDPALRQRFLDGMSYTACTVSVVTTDGELGRAGVTVSAMSSVSADTPRPTLLVCVHHLSRAASKIVENGVFCVNVLQDHQAHISDTFAGRRDTRDGDRFSCAEWTTQVTGAPRVVDPLVAFDCDVVSSERVGTHHVFIGEVRDIFTSHQGSPLIFANRAYGSPTRFPLAAWRPTNSEATPPLTIGCFHTFGPFILPDLLARMKLRAPAVDVRIVDGDQRTVVATLLSGETELGLAYDLDLPRDLECSTLTELEPYVLIAEGHPLADAETLRSTDLVDEPMVLLDAPPSRAYFLSIFEAEGLQPNIAYASSSLEMVRGMVGHGLGFALLATKPAAAMTYDGKALVSRPLETDVPHSKIVLARKRGTPASRAGRAFEQVCRDVFHTDP